MWKGQKKKKKANFSGFAKCIGVQIISNARDAKNFNTFHNYSFLFDVKRPKKIANFSGLAKCIGV